MPNLSFNGKVLELGGSGRLNFPTPTPTIPTILDRDLNEYTTVIIGTQEWTVENFKCTKFADGTSITDGDIYANWVDANGAYCNYNADPLIGDVYGYIYSGYAIRNAKGLSYFTKDTIVQTGWRLASQGDWDTLYTYLGGAGVATPKMKEAGSDHWPLANDGTNESGLSVLGGGHRDYSGAFTNLKSGTGIFTSTVAFTNYYKRVFFYQNFDASTNDNGQLTGGGYLRFVKDVV